jgi:hypothetical protein
VSDLHQLVQAALDDPGTGWSMGTRGAIAEFVRLPGEPAVRDGGSVVTARGGVRVVLPPGVVALAYRTPVGPGGHWNHAVALCVPEEPPGRSAITELGPDPASLRPTGGILFDLGLGLPSVAACVRTDDPALVELLRGACGQRLFDPANGVAARLVEAGPHRVFTTACGRVEVYAAIPPPDGRSPDGPHTHLLPQFLREGRTHAATVPVPPGYVPVAHLYPPHPLTDITGRPIPYDADRARAFDALVSRFGDPAQRRVEDAVAAALAAGRGPDAAPDVPDAPGRAALAVALRRAAHAGIAPELVAAWRRRAGPSGEDERDPDGDRNAG